MKITAHEEYGLRCVLQLAREQTADSDGNLEPCAIFVRDIAAATVTLVRPPEALGKGLLPA